MYLSKHSNGYYYVYFYNDQGKRNSISTQVKTKNDALKFLSRFNYEIELKKKQNKKELLVSDYCEKFLDFSQARHTLKTYTGYRLTLSNFRKYVGDVLLNEISPEIISEYFHQKLKTSSIYQARKDLICINSLFNKANAEGLLIGNPCLNIKRFRIPQKQPLFFNEAQFNFLLEVIHDNDIRELVIFAVQTGMRQMELLTLRWEQINLEQGLLLLDNREHLTKSKKIRTIPLSKKALAILTNRKQNAKTDVVFTLHGKTIKQEYISKKFKAYVLKAKIDPKLNFHSLRHTFASWLVQRGVSIFQVSKLLGHSNVRVTEIYSHLRSEDLQNAISKLD